MSSLMSYIAVLAETTGPGVLQAATCPGISLSYLLGARDRTTGAGYLRRRSNGLILTGAPSPKPSRVGSPPRPDATALTTMFFSMLNVVWMVIAVEGYRQRKYLPVVLVIVWHLAASYIVRSALQRSPAGVAAGRPARSRQPAPRADPLLARTQTMFNNVAWMGGCAVNLSLLALMTCAGLGYLVMRAMKLKDA